MKIIIDNSGYDLLNLGDVAMLQVAVSRLKYLWPQSTIHIITNSPERLQKYCPNTVPLSSFDRFPWLAPWNIFGGIHHLFPSFMHQSLQELETYGRMTRPKMVKQWVNYRRSPDELKQMNHFLDILEDSNLFIASGGGYMVDDFDYHSIPILETLLTAKSLEITTALVGQGFSDITKPKLYKMMKTVLPSVDFISLREQRVGLKFLSTLDVPESGILVTGDDAIELAHQCTPENLGKAIGVNLRLASYSRITSSDNWLEILRQTLIETSSNFSVPLLGVPISRYSGESDGQSIDNFLGIKNNSSENLDSPELVCLQVGKCRIVVTSSYHGGVFALSQGISVVGLAKSVYYQDKFLGLAEQFGLGCYVVNVSNSNISHELPLVIQQAWEEAPNNRDKLLKAAKKQIDLSKLAYQSIYKKVTEN